jgi:hypothetical protein
MPISTKAVLDTALFLHEAETVQAEEVAQVSHTMVQKKSWANPPCALETATGS